jgi:hypothetical protein
MTLGFNKWRGLGKHEEIYVEKFAKSSLADVGGRQSEKQYWGILESWVTPSLPGRNESNFEPRTLNPELAFTHSLHPAPGG